MSAEEHQKLMTTAIMVDGGFYLKRARILFGSKSPKDRAKELDDYCRDHIRKHGDRHLYRVFYYDCHPSDDVVWNPIENRNIGLAKSSIYKWSIDFHEELKSKRKFAIRMGETLKTQDGFTMKKEAIKAIMRGKRSVADLTIDDFRLDITQKGVDMKLGLDIASLAYMGKVDQIIMISGDSDFVPAAKLARRLGVDFILDPMWHPISKSLNEHIDGIESCCEKPTAKNGSLS